MDLWLGGSIKLRFLPILIPVNANMDDTVVSRTCAVMPSHTRDCVYPSTPMSLDLGCLSLERNAFTVCLASFGYGHSCPLSLAFFTKSPSFTLLHFDRIK